VHYKVEDMHNVGYKQTTKVGIAPDHNTKTGIAPSHGQLYGGRVVPKLTTDHPLDRGKERERFGSGRIIKLNKEELPQESDSVAKKYGGTLVATFSKEENGVRNCGSNEVDVWDTFYEGSPECKWLQGVFKWDRELCEDVCACMDADGNPVAECSISPTRIPYAKIISALRKEGEYWIDTDELGDAALGSPWSVAGSFREMLIPPQKTVDVGLQYVSTAYKFRASGSVFNTSVLLGQVGPYLNNSAACDLRVDVSSVSRVTADIVAVYVFATNTSTSAPSLGNVTPGGNSDWETLSVNGSGGDDLLLTFQTAVTGIEDDVTSNLVYMYGRGERRCVLPATKYIWVSFLTLFGWGTLTPPVTSTAMVTLHICNSYGHTGGRSENIVTTDVGDGTAATMVTQVVNEINGQPLVAQVINEANGTPLVTEVTNLGTQSLRVLVENGPDGVGADVNIVGFNSDVPVWTSMDDPNGEATGNITMDNVDKNLKNVVCIFGREGISDGAWHVTTQVDGVNLRFSHSTKRGCKKLLNDCANKYFGRQVMLRLIEADGFSEYEQKVRNKKMHSLNGNTDFSTTNHWTLPEDIAAEQASLKYEEEDFASLIMGESDTREMYVERIAEDDTRGQLEEDYVKDKLLKMNPFYPLFLTEGITTTYANEEDWAGDTCALEIDDDKPESIQEITTRVQKTKKVEQEVRKIMPKNEIDGNVLSKRAARMKKRQMIWVKMISSCREDMLLVNLVRMNASASATANCLACVNNELVRSLHEKRDNLKHQAKWRFLSAAIHMRDMRHIGTVEWCDEVADLALNVSGWSEVCSEIHNKLMHALNGNIDAERMTAPWEKTALGKPMSTLQEFYMSKGSNMLAGQGMYELDRAGGYVVRSVTNQGLPVPDVATINGPEVFGKGRMCTPPGQVPVLSNQRMEMLRIQGSNASVTRRIYELTEDYQGWLSQVTRTRQDAITVRNFFATDLAIVGRFTGKSDDWRLFFCKLWAIVWALGPNEQKWNFWPTNLSTRQMDNTFLIDTNTANGNVQNPIVQRNTVPIFGETCVYGGLRHAPIMSGVQEIIWYVDLVAAEDRGGKSDTIIVIPPELITRTANPNRAIAFLLLGFIEGPRSFYTHVFDTINEGATLAGECTVTPWFNCINFSGITSTVHVVLPLQNRVLQRPGNPVAARNAAMFKPSIQGNAVDFTTSTGPISTTNIDAYIDAHISTNGSPIELLGLMNMYADMLGAHDDLMGAKEWMLGLSWRAYTLQGVNDPAATPEAKYMSIVTGSVGFRKTTDSMGVNGLAMQTMGVDFPTTVERSSYTVATPDAGLWSRIAMGMVMPVTNDRKFQRASWDGMDMYRGLIKARRIFMAWEIARDHYGISTTDERDFANGSGNTSMVRTWSHLFINIGGVFGGGRQLVGKMDTWLSWVYRAYMQKELFDNDKGEQIMRYAQYVPYHCAMVSASNGLTLPTSRVCCYTDFWIRQSMSKIHARYGQARPYLNGDGTLKMEQSNCSWTYSGRVITNPNWGLPIPYRNKDEYRGERQALMADDAEDCWNRRIIVLYQMSEYLTGNGAVTVYGEKNGKFVRTFAFGVANGTGYAGTVLRQPGILYEWKGDIGAAHVRTVDGWNITKILLQQSANVNARRELNNRLAGGYSNVYGQRLISIVEGVPSLTGGNLEVEDDPIWSAMGDVDEVIEQTDDSTPAEVPPSISDTQNLGITYENQSMQAVQQLNTNG
jgi:hypothetical protein